MNSLPDLNAREAALEPDSCIVQAPAGSGKTTLLATRYIRLLSLVDRPQEILAITFTKKAAAEMRQRVLQMLNDDAEWSQLARRRNEELGWNIFRNPNALKIQTIDSFAMELASQSHDRDVLGQVEILENATIAYESAAANLLHQLVDDAPTAPLIASFLASLNNDAQAATRLITTMLAKRDQWLELTREIATNLDEAQAKLKVIVGNTIEKIHLDSSKALLSLLDDEDHDVLSQFAGKKKDSLAGLPGVLTKSGMLRRRFTRNDGVGDAQAVRALNQWLTSLHERGLAAPIEQHARLPSTLSQDELQQLTQCAVILTLVAAELRQVFTDSDTIDFVELLVSAKAALRDADGAATDLALLLDYRIKHLLVDEYQDTSRPQHEFFALLCEAWNKSSGNTIFAVGDPMQSIYRFRDADVRIFSETIDSGIQSIALAHYQLNANFRSEAPIVEWCNHVFTSLFTDDLPYSPAVPMQNQNEAAGDDPVRCYRFDDGVKEARYTVNQIVELLERDPSCDVALLCRARSQIEHILAALKERSIPWRANDIDPLSKVPIVRDLHAALLTLIRPGEKLSLMSVLRSPMIGLSMAELTRLQPESIDTLRVATGAPRIDRFLIAYDWARTKIHQRAIREVLHGFWLRLGGAQVYDQSAWLVASAYLDLLDRYGRGRVDIDELELALGELYAPSNDAARLHIMTIHKAKGLEFDHVFVPVLNHRTRSDDPELISIEQHPAGLVMGSRGYSVHEWITHENRQLARAEEKRLLYVACTRAKKSLTLTWSQAPDAKPTGLARYLEAHVTDRYDQFADTDEGSLEPTIDAGFLQTDLFNNRLRTRLPADFVWQSQSSSKTPEELDPVAPTIRDSLDTRIEVATGTLVHKALAWLSQRGIDGDLTKLPTLIDQWSDHLIQAEAKTNAFKQVERFANSSLGLWCLNDHEQAVSEYPVTGILEGELRHIVIDRMFVVAGERWILDYKSTQTEQDAHALIARYRSQLDNYAQICANLFPEPIRKALVLTESSELIEIQ